MVPSCGPRGCGTLRALARLAGIQEQLRDCVTARDPGKLDRGKAWRAGTHPGVHRPTAPRPATFRTRLPRRYPRLFPLARSPFLHASRVPPSLAFGFHGSPRPRERLRRRVPDARARQPPGESCAHAQWPASREGGGLSRPDPEVLVPSGAEKRTAARWGAQALALGCQYATVAPSVPEGLDGQPQCRAPGPWGGVQNTGTHSSWLGSRKPGWDKKGQDKVNGPPCKSGSPSHFRTHFLVSRRLPECGFRNIARCCV